MTDSEKCLFIFLMCEASKKGTGEFSCETAYLAAILQKKENDIIKDFNNLLSYGVLKTSNGRPTDVQETSNVPPRIEESKKRVRKETTMSTDVDPNEPILISIWNNNSGNLAKAVRTNASRNRQSLARWKENPSTEYWTETIRRIAQSSFCNGKNNNGWRATFDWLLQPDVHLKVNEGKYDNRGADGVPVDIKRKQESEAFRKEMEEHVRRAQE